MPILSSSSDRLLQTLQLVAASPQPLSAKDMAQQLALPPSTLYRQLTHLSQWGLLQAGADGAYHAGPLGLQLAMGFQRHNTLAAQARPEMQRLARLSNETVALMVATRQQVICIEMMESQQALRCAFAAGRASRWRAARRRWPCWPSCRPRTARPPWTACCRHRNTRPCARPWPRYAARATPPATAPSMPASGASAPLAAGAAQTAGRLDLDGAFRPRPTPRPAGRANPPGRAQYQRLPGLRLSGPEPKDQA